jgi:hypothetical protein
VGIDLVGSPVEHCTRIVWMYRHLPTTDAADAQLWVLGITDPSTAVLAYKDTTWHTVTMPDALVIDGVSEYQVQGQSLHEKLFIAYKSAQDRLHVFVPGDTALRRTGLAQPATPTNSETAVVGTYSGVRYARVRFTEQVGGVTKRRSEPSDTRTITPSGTKTGIIINRPALLSEGETHWELELSLDDANYYVFATSTIATLTVTDTTAYTVGYAVAYDLSEDIGDYELFPSVRFLAAEQNRLAAAGSFEDAALSSRVMWSPVFGDPGVGNDERVPADTVNYLDLDTHEGGALTGLSATVNGYMYVTKLSHTYQLSRSGVRTRAYEDRALTKQRGAIYGSLVAALDQSGNPSPFMLDPDIGPCRVGPRGVEPCGADVARTWETVNLDATKVVCRSLYYPEKQQVLWNIATGTANIPNLGLTLHTASMRDTLKGLRGGWAVWDGGRTAALAMCLFAINIDDDTDRSGVLVPFIGVEGNGLVWRCDTGNTDNGTAFEAYVTSKAFMRRLLLDQFTTRRGVLLAQASDGASIVVTVVGNFGLPDEEQEAEAIDLTPTGTEPYVIRPIDDLGLSELYAVQVKFADPEGGNATAPWALDFFALRDETGARA